MSFHFDTREFTAAMRQYEAATHKDENEIVNRAARNVVLRTMSFTIKTTAARIRSELRALGPGLYKVVNWKRAREGKRPLGGEKMAVAAKAFVAKRARSAAYIRAGWIKAAQSFGAQMGGRVSEKGNAAKGYATKAGGMKHFAEIVNTANEALKIGGPALQKAIAFVADDMRSYAERKMSETSRRFSV